jgi:hypothetical protein
LPKQRSRVGSNQRLTTARCWRVEEWQVMSEE